MNKTQHRDYPRRMDFGTSNVELRMLSAADQAALTRFIATLPVHDLLFVSRDISHPKVMAAWLDALSTPGLVSLAAWHGEEMVGSTAIVSDPLSWSQHVGEMRVLVTPAWRGRGLGRWLIEESFAIALGMGLEKLTVQMTVDQRAAIGAFEDLGFRAEAVLRKQVKDREGNAHDLVLLSHDVAAGQSLMQVFGQSEALQG